MYKSKLTVLWLTLIVLLAFSQGTIAQDTEKTKSDIMYKMHDFNARFQLIFLYTDSETRNYLAGKAKASFLEFKTLAEPNLDLFDGGKDKVKEVLKGAEKILLKDEVFNTLNTPNYRNESKPEKGEVLEDKWIDIHKAAEYVLIKELVVRANFRIYTLFSKYGAVADLRKNGPAASYPRADSLLKRAPIELGGAYNFLKADNNEESRIALNDGVNAFRVPADKQWELVQALYERPNTLVMSEEGQKNDLQLKSKYASSKVWQNGLIREMKETEKFAMVISPVDNPGMRNDIYIFGKYLRAKAGETPDITYRIVAPGITQVDYGKIKIVPSWGNRIGYISTITYHCPISIEVLNKEGKVDQTFIIIDDKATFKTTWNANWVAADPNRGEVPFPSDTAYYEALDKYKGLIHDRLYHERFKENTVAMANLLNDAYGYYKVPNSFYYLYDVKNPEAGFQELKGLCDSTDFAVEHLEDQATSLQTKATLAKLVDRYQEILQRPGISQNVKNLCARNSVTCALLADQVSRALFLLDRCKAINPKDTWVVPMNLSSFMFRTLFDDAAQREIVLPARSDLWKY